MRLINSAPPRKVSADSGFTLIELSIVLVIIGLIVGGVLVGRDLIKASEIRAQITQIEKYQTAVNTFRGKYSNYLPGDIPEPEAGRFGFIARGTDVAQGDGNGIIEGFCAPGCPMGIMNLGETTVAWVDLTKAGLIDGSFTSATSTGFTTPATGSAIARYIPSAVMSNGNYVYIWSYNGIMYFGLSAITSLQGGWNPFSNSNIQVNQAYMMDKKVDDGFPRIGRVIAQFVDHATATTIPAWAPNGASDTASTCFNTATGNGTYSTGYNNGGGANCAVSFKFQ